MPPTQPADTPPSVAAAFQRHDYVGYVRAGQILSEIVQGPGWSRSVRGEAGEKGLFVSTSSFPPALFTPLLFFPSSTNFFPLRRRIKSGSSLSFYPPFSVCERGGGGVRVGAAGLR